MTEDFISRWEDGFKICHSKISSEYDFLIMSYFNERLNRLYSFALRENIFTINDGSDHGMSQNPLADLLDSRKYDRDYDGFFFWSEFH